jgi:hypothetical protein
LPLAICLLLPFLLRHFADYVNSSPVFQPFYELGMVVGFNHNFRYKGELFHVQTEDSGLKSPHVVTLLYRGGTILASRKTSYADITKVDRLEQVVEELMKEQHRDMLRRLKEGEFDEIIAGRRPAVAPAVMPQPVPPAPVAAASPQRETASTDQQTVAITGKTPEVLPGQTPIASPEQRPVRGDASLDEIILSYLLGEGEDPKKS